FTSTRVTSRKSKQRLKRPSKLRIAEPAPVELRVIRLPEFALNSMALDRFCVVPSPIEIEAPGCALKAPNALLPSSVTDPATDKSAMLAPPEIVVLAPVTFTFPSKSTPLQLIDTAPEFARLTTDPAEVNVSVAPFNVEEVRPETVEFIMSRVLGPAPVAFNTPTFIVVFRATSPPRCTLIVPTLIVPLAVQVASLALLIKIVAFERLLLARLSWFCAEPEPISSIVPAVETEKPEEDTTKFPSTSSVWLFSERDAAVFASQVREAHAASAVSAMLWFAAENEFSSITTRLLASGTWFAGAPPELSDHFVGSFQLPEFPTQ